MTSRPLHKIGVYFGVADLTPEEERERQLAEDRELARPLRSVLLEVLAAAVFMGAAFGWAISLNEPGSFDVFGGVFFGAVMGGVKLSQDLAPRRRARRRLEQRSP